MLFISNSLVFSSSLPSWVPADSPLALGLHPRLMFIPQSYRDTHPDAVGITVQEMRDKLNTYYKKEFQEFIDLMDSLYDSDISVKSKRDISNDAMNYAFLYIIDPSVMSKSPYNFTFNHTRLEYGLKAKEHALQIANNILGDPNVCSKGGCWFDGRYPFYGRVNLALSVVNDWCNSLFNETERKILSDAILYSYEKYYNKAGYSPLKLDGIYLNSGVIGEIHNGIGVLGFIGDFDNDLNYTNKLIDVANKIVKESWIDNVINFSNYLYGDICGYRGGMPNYHKYAFVNFANGIQIISTALNIDYFYKSVFFKTNPLYILYNAKPFPYNGKFNYYHYDDDGPSSSILGKWGQNYLYLFYYPANKLKETYPVASKLAKWIKDKSGYILTIDISRGAESDIRYRYLRFYFFNGDRDVVAESPSELKIPLSAKVGDGEFVMRTGFESINDTLVVFWAPKFKQAYSHNHHLFASFTIEKYGNLAIQRSINKAFRGGNIDATKRNIFYNTIGVYRPGDMRGNYNLMSYRENFDKKARNQNDPAYQEGGANHVGNVKAYDLNGKYYDYIDYDYTRAWSNPDTVTSEYFKKRYPWKVSYAEREFVYLRPQGGVNDEYVVVFDRVETLDPSYTKFFLLHSSFEPKLINSMNKEITMIPEDYPNDADGIPGGRWVRKDTTPSENNIIEITNTWNGSHGRLFSKTLLPEKFQINKVGGPGHYWEDAEGRLIWTGDLTDEEKNYRGTYTMQIQSTTGQKFDYFLHVMQFGDSNTLTEMNPVTRIDADTMVGAFINDPAVPRVVLFSKGQHGEKVSTVTYSAHYSASKTGKHLLVDMQSGAYDIYKDGVKILNNVQVSSNGVLFFSSPGGASFKVVRVGEYTDVTPPSPPPAIHIMH